MTVRHKAHRRSPASRRKPKKASKPEWEEKQRLAAKLYQVEFPTAKVTHAETLPGKLSGTARKADVTVRPAGDGNELIVSDVKHHKRSVNLCDFGVAVTQARDIGATRAEIVSTSGFSGGVRTYAKAEGVVLRRLVERIGRDVVNPILTYALVQWDRMAWCQFAVTLYRETSVPAAARFFAADGRELGSLESIVKDDWNSGRLDSTPGDHGLTPIGEQPSFVRVDGQLKPIGLQVKYGVDTFRTLKRIPTWKEAALQVDGGPPPQEFISTSAVADLGDLGDLIMIPDDVEPPVHCLKGGRRRWPFAE